MTDRVRRKPLIKWTSTRLVIRGHSQKGEMIPNLKRQKKQQFCTEWHLLEIPDTLGRPFYWQRGAHARGTDETHRANKGRTVIIGRLYLMGKREYGESTATLQQGTLTRYTYTKMTSTKRRLIEIMKLLHRKSEKTLQNYIRRQRPSTKTAWCTIWTAKRNAEATNRGIHRG